MAKLTKKEIAEYQAKIDEARKQLLYAQCYTPNKVGYYQYILTGLLNTAPLQCR